MTSAPSNACLAVVPIRSFSDAKSRLAPALNASERRELTVELAERVIGALGSVECRVLTNDPEVASWADGLGIAVLSPAELEAAGLPVPPLHPHCRSDLLPVL